MQIVWHVKIDADEYAATQAHLAIERPPSCPHCKARKTLLALGYYERRSTAKESGRDVLIKVRRFVCSSCRRTLSLLPSFAQPYRLVCSVTIERFFNGAVFGADTLTWRHLLRRYWRRFTQWLPKLMKTIGRVLGLSPPHAPSKGSWLAIVAAYGQLDRATRTLVRQFQVTIFGRYRCHRLTRPQIGT
jgi:hypothetical protein